MKKNVLKTLFELFVVLITSFLTAVNIHVFVNPASFAPAGVDGISTMVYNLTGLNAGWVSLFINLPLLIIGLFLLNKKFVIYTLIHTIVSSGLLILFEYINFYEFIPDGESLLSAIFSGLLCGVRTGLMLKIGASSGGIDIPACIIQKRHPEKNTEIIITVIAYVIIASSIFVYKDIKSILLSVVQMFVFEKTANFVQKDKRNAIEFNIVTKNPKEITEEIIVKLKHGVTIVNSKGGYTGEESYTLHTIVNRRQIADVMNIIKKYPNTFIYYNNVIGVKGNFRWDKNEEAK